MNGAYNKINRPYFDGLSMNGVNGFPGNKAITPYVSPVAYNP
jgi:hypothetical protein